MANKHDEIKDLRQFGIVLAGVLTVLGFIHFLRARTVLSENFALSGGAVLILALIMPKALKGIYGIFKKVTHAIGWFNTRVILIAIYFLILAPIAILMKISGKEFLDRKIDKKADSYWIKRTVFAVSKEQLEKQF
jgi:hypothetical protein